MGFKKIIFLTAAAVCLLLGTGAAAQAADIPDISILVQGSTSGAPAFPKIILELSQPAQEIHGEEITVTTAGTPRTVQDVYLCDENGVRTDAPSSYAAVELKTTAQESGSPFTYNRSVRMNEWSEAYEVTVSSPSFTIDGMTAPLSPPRTVSTTAFVRIRKNSKPTGKCAGSTKSRHPWAGRTDASHSCL